MSQALEVFVNGISGVFAGIAVLYIAIRLNSAFAGRETGKKE